MNPNRIRRRSTRIRSVPALATAAALAAAGPAAAATTQSASQAISGSPTPQLVATFQPDFTFATFSPGATATSGEQVINVRSNSSWGLRVSGDAASMRRWNGSAYVAGALGSALEWAKTSQGGAAVGSPAWASIVASPATASVVTGAANTSNAGTDVGVSFRQAVSYADEANIGTDTYRIVVTYAAGQAF